MGEIAASVTDKSVAQLVCLTAPWAGERESKCTRVSAKAAACARTHTHKHILTHTHKGRPLSQAAPEEVQGEDRPQEGNRVSDIPSPFHRKHVKQA